MTALRSILTHPGGAHKDDFLACAVLLARHAVPLERREPTAADLEDRTVAVVDVGGRHDPAAHNFDHHQLPRDGVPTCALSLVLQSLDRYADAQLFCDWLEMAEWLDCRGAVATARHFGFERSVLDQLLSPLDVTLLRRFAQSTRLEPGETLWELMRWVGGDLLDYLDTMHARIVLLGETVEWWDFVVGETPVRLLFLARTDPPLEDPSLGLDRFIRQQPPGPAIIGTVSPDRRGPGYGLSRVNDDARLDFTRIEAALEVHFAHANGFVAKTSASDPARLRALVEASLVDPSAGG